MPEEKNEVYSESIKLPSLGKLYPVDHPLHNKESIEIKPMTTYEEDILTSRNLAKKNIVIDTLIRSCLVDKSIDPLSLYSFDRNAILIAIRALSYGADYEVNIVCPDDTCEHRFLHMFDLSKIEIKHFDGKEAEHDQNFEFPFVLPSSKKKLKFRFLTAQDERDLLLEAQAQQSKLKAGSENFDSIISNTISNRWIRNITSFDGETSKMLIAPKVRSMLARDSSALRVYINKISPGPILDFKIQCPQCNNIFIMMLPIERNFFWPSFE